MPSRGQSITAHFTVWDTVANAPVTGDASNLTLRWLKDDTLIELTGTPAIAEVSSTLAPGVYKVTLAATDCTCNTGTLCGASSTTNAVVIPVHYTFEQLPTATPGNSSGVARVQDIAGQILASPTQKLATDASGNVGLSDQALDDIVESVLDEADGVESTISLRKALRAMLSVLVGKDSGAETNEISFRNPGDTIDRVVASVDADGNRTAVTLNLD